MATVRPHSTVLIGGVPQTAVIEWQTVARRNQPSIATITLPYPMGAEVVLSAPVIIEAAAVADDAEMRRFYGVVSNVRRTHGSDGKKRTVQCSGWGSLLQYELESPLRFAGGAETDPVSIGPDPVHIGNHSRSWYAVPTPDGLTSTYTFTPPTDARFVRVTGAVHGTNSWPVEPERDVTDFSRIEVWQDGRKKGYANLPTVAEQHDAELDYTDAANWEDFDLTIGAAINHDDGDVSLIVVSGRKPNSSERDDFEIKGVQYQIAGRTDLAELVASILKDRGFGASGNGVPYRTQTVRALTGERIYLGGNGLIQNGQVVLDEGDDPWSWMADAVDLFGFALIDGPDDVHLSEMRGTPDSDMPIVAAYEQGVNAWTFDSPNAIDGVVTRWTIYGASGTDERGQPFQYQSQGTGSYVPEYIPDPPGIIPIASPVNCS